MLSIDRYDDLFLLDLGLCSDIPANVFLLNVLIVFLVWFVFFHSPLAPFDSSHFFHLEISQFRNYAYFKIYENILYART